MPTYGPAPCRRRAISGLNGVLGRVFQYIFFGFPLDHGVIIKLIGLLSKVDNTRPASRMYKVRAKLVPYLWEMGANVKPRGNNIKNLCPPFPRPERQCWRAGHGNGGHTLGTPQSRALDAACALLYICGCTILWSVIWLWLHSGFVAIDRQVVSTLLSVWDLSG